MVPATGFAPDRYGYDDPVTRTSYLRVYQPITALPQPERDAWESVSDESEGPELNQGRRWLLRSSLPAVEPFPGPTEGAFVRRVNGRLLICPWRTRLRMLAGLLAFRGTVPDEVADAFVPEPEARKAARELERLEVDHPEVRSHIIHANWYVPLRWFAAFDETERILTEDKHGLRIRYEATLGHALIRLERAIGVLEGSWIDDGVVAAVKELAEWIGGFSEEGLLELDYGSVAGIFSDEDLLEDHSAAEVGACLDALETGDVIHAGRVFAELTERWTEIRAKEVVN
jgi:hypothetical protein